MRKLGLGLGINRGGTSSPITATSLPTLAQLYVGDTILSGYTSGTYASSAGAISSEVETYYQNGVSVLSSTTVADGDQIRVTSVVTDALGNVRTFNTSTVIVTYTAPTVSAQPTITPAMDEPGGVFTLDLGTAANTTPVIDYFRLNSTDVSGDLSGLTYTAPASPEGTITLRVRYTNSGGTVYSNEVSAVSNTNPAITSPDLDETQTPALLSFTASEAGTLYYATNGSATALAGSAIKALVDGAAQDIYGTAAVEPGSVTITLDLSNLASGTYYLHTSIRDSLGGYSTDTVYTITVSDATAPTLSSPTDATSGSTGYTGSVSTNEANGTLYWVVTTSSTAPTKAQVKAGQDNSGVAATASGSQAVTTTGAQTIGGSGLTAATAYTIHYMHEDASANQSTVVSGDGFTTDAAGSAPTFQAAGTFAAVNSTSNPLTVAWPTHQSGDLGVLVLACRADKADPAPSGWTLLGTTFNTGAANSSHRKVGIYTKTAASAAEASVVDNGNGAILGGGIFTVRGSTSINYLGTAGTGSGTSHTMPGGATGGANRLVVPFFVTTLDTSGTALSGSFSNADLTGLTTRVEFQVLTAEGLGIYIASGTRAASATIASTTASTTTTSLWGGATLIFAP